MTVKRIPDLEVYAVECGGSCERKGYPHLVTFSPKLNAYTCDCPAGLQQRTCKHVRETRHEIHEAGIAQLRSDRADRIANGTARPEDLDPFYGLV